MTNETKGKGFVWQTRVLDPSPKAPSGFRSLAPAVYRGSTVTFDRLADAHDDWRGNRYTYGLYGTPTTRELGARVAQLESAHASFVVPGGQSAILLIYLTFCKADSHILLPDSAYGPNAELADGLLAGLGIEVESYDPLIGAGIAALIRPTTRLIWCESPGSITMEIQDVPAIVTAAHDAGVPVALDNTYAAGVFFDAFAHGVDVSMQAITKYVGGHSDLLLATVSVIEDAMLERVGTAHRLLGLAVSPDDCALALRGLQTLAIRLQRLEGTAIEVARWCKEQTEIDRVLHPALEDCPGHDIWRRDFTGSSSVFSIVLGRDWSGDRVTRFVEALRIFRIGFSWGGTTALVMAYESLPRKTGAYEGWLVRLNVGLEDPADLIADLEQAFAGASR
ncbi:cystathionine beta-lyase [Mesorhizobium amorphae]|uniref:cystathionine beta-lyase n=1 Tax=Mesorhizobium amorphae TaxID=71433 RepID=UPI001185BF9F|nr:cystathionine beta-lyase [Mesorhizobium amorphae]